MKKSIKNRITRVFILSTLLISFNSCKSKEAELKELKIAKKIAHYLIEKDSLNFYNYSNEVYLHISSERLNQDTFKTLVTLHGLTTKSIDLKKEEFTIKGLKTIVYSNGTNGENKLADVFYVPDAKSWSFFSEYYYDEIWLNQLSRIYFDKELATPLPDELDF